MPTSRHFPARRAAGSQMQRDVQVKLAWTIDRESADELNVNFIWNDSALVAFGEQSVHGFPATVGVIEGQLIDPHGDEPVRQVRIHIAGKLHGVSQRVLTIVERVLNALSSRSETS